MNHQNVVESVKNKLTSAGLDLQGPCGAFTIVKHVAWELRAEGAGLLSKPSGNNCDGYATDIICYPDGHIWDVLVDGGGANGPTWEDAGMVDPDRYRIAIDPGDTPIPTPTPPPVPPTPPTDLTPLWVEINHVKANLAALSARLDNVVAYFNDKITEVAHKPIPELEVTGNTNRVWGHTHNVKLDITPKK